MEAREVVEQALQISGSGRSTDIIARSLVLVNLLSEKEPYQAVELKDVQHLWFMMQEADKYYIYVANDWLYFTAHYSFFTDYPVTRIYYVKVGGLHELANLREWFSKKGIEFPMIPPFRLAELIGADGSLERVKRYLGKKEEGFTSFRGLFKGRKAATTNN